MFQLSWMICIQLSPKTTYSGGVTQVVLSTYKRTDIGGDDAYNFDTRKVSQMADNEESVNIRNQLVKIW